MSIVRAPNRALAMAGGAAAPSPAQQGRILSLVQGCARDQSFGEGQVEQLKKKSAELMSQLELARSELETKKARKKSAEEELKCLEVELSSVEATIQSRQARLENKQLEIADTRSLLEELKRKQVQDRDQFIQESLELNASIRQLQESSSRIVCEACERC
ncbi:uncharacterized protein LOC112350310 [Selaginella moellendorffii]|uniref:uncharacterized protein LOC112350310 n=1 Tax=Selaginella moellendorffii TaxID=88036 RepID=UPI000D1C88E3|nr:uncharacterized protein LOC112350310 [Selaginella moellendorffii]|eukprot:XP_024542037.1 uncharacterized protein LOC112350310 [Selaginella moellendorffii]